MNKHTPGPWKVLDSKSPLASHRVRIVDSQGHTVATCASYDNHGYAEANARIIARAPTMYKLLNTIASSRRGADNNEIIDMAKAFITHIDD
jgi:hypothetical protein